ncbi:MAG: Tuberous sclerosis 2-like protein [Alyxoria varia]|nr:MAG: Tuberous sclerosis 2-like protein [Alyxoria varia]
MSRFLDADPTQAPKHRPSNSSLLASLRSFTNPKPRQQSLTASPKSDPSTPSISTSSAQSISLADSRTVGTRSNNTYSLTSSSHSEYGMAEPALSDEASLSSFAQDIQTLGPDNTLPQRILAAKTISNLLGQYEKPDILEIWSKGRDLLSHGHDPEALDSAYELFGSCARHRPLNAREKHLLFDSIPRAPNQSTLLKSFTVLLELTNHGEDLSDLEHDAMPFSVSYLENCWNARHEARKEKLREERERKEKSREEKDRREKRKKDPQDLQEEVNLKSIFDFVLAIVKFNSFIFSEADIELLIDCILRICRNTHKVSDLESALKVLEALVTYSCLPLSSLKSIVEILSGITCSVKDLKDATWHAFQILLGSHLGPKTQDVLDSLLEQNTTTGPQLHKNVVRGALRILAEMIRSQKPKFVSIENLPKALSSVLQAIKDQDEKICSDALLVVQALVKCSDARTLVFDKAVWPQFEEILCHCSDRGVNDVVLTANIGTSKGRSTQAGEGAQQAPDDEDDAQAGDDDVNKQTAEQARKHAAEEVKRQAALEAKIQVDEMVQQTAERLIDLAEERTEGEVLSAMRLLLRVVPRLNVTTAMTVVEYYSRRVFIPPAGDGWQLDYHVLLRYVTKDQDLNFSLRKRSIQVLHHAYNVAESAGSPVAPTMIEGLVSCIFAEKEPAVQDELRELCVDVADTTHNFGAFDHIVNTLSDVVLRRYERPSESSTTSTEPSNPSTEPSAVHTDPTSPSFASTIASCVVRVFLRTINRSVEKTLKIYQCLLEITRSKDAAADARIIALKALFRLRADAGRSIYIVSSTDCQYLAAQLCRTADTAANELQDSPLVRPSKPEDQVARRSQAGASAGAVAARKAAGPSRGSGATSRRVSKPNPPLWFYPGPRGLPEEPPKYASRLFSSGDTIHPDGQIPAVQQSTDGNLQQPQVLKVYEWLELLLGILQEPELEWEVYSYIIVHLGAQLTNHALFAQSLRYVRFLRNVLCDQLASKTHHAPPPYANLKKSDVEVCFYHILTVLISYREYLGRSEQEEIVKMFVLGLGANDRSTEICIHSLSVCCHDMQMALIRQLGSVLDRFSTIITQSHAAVDILEFLASLARRPKLFKDFSEYEFKRVIGICFKYLEYARDKKEARSKRVESGVEGQERSSGGSQYVSQVSRVLSPTALSDDLPQYVHQLANHVMLFWFMAQKLENRPKHIPWIKKSLAYGGPDGTSYLDEQSQVNLDMMERVAYSDRDESGRNENFASPDDGIIKKKSWVVGMSIITIETAGRTGLSQVSVGRPSGTRYSIFTPNLLDQPAHQQAITYGSDAQEFNSNDYIGILPDHVLQELYSPLVLASPTAHGADLTIPIPDDFNHNMDIRLFEAIPSLDSHRCGIIYVGEGQETESEMLANEVGSPDYTHFIRRIGTPTKLDGTKIYTHGLDTSGNNEDGEYTFCWRDRVCEVVFHVTTLMPTNLEMDPQCNHKKKHIGNDYVNIIFNNSGGSGSWDINTFPSDFNWVNIVITPEARASLLEPKKQAEEGTTSSPTETPAATVQPEQQEQDPQQPQHQQPEQTTATATATAASTDPTAPSKHYTPSGERLKEESPHDRIFYRVTVIAKPGLPPLSPASSPKIVSGKSLHVFVRLLALNASFFCGVWSDRESAGGAGEKVSSWRARAEAIGRLRDRALRANSAAAAAAVGQGQGREQGRK